MESIKVHCSRCRSSKLGHHEFEINLKTNEYYKSCIKCRECDKQNKIKIETKLKLRKENIIKKIKRCVKNR